METRDAPQLVKDRATFVLLLFVVRLEDCEKLISAWILKLKYFEAVPAVWERGEPAIQ